ncbi:family 43 glycosylhydrolase [Anaerorhabdus sp.]|uniref:family 43 glycosylhydrolase n=1 Tax=Anaerorhabdus sp. TaxID=1872524 RepID=UPI002FCBEDCB
MKKLLIALLTCLIVTGCSKMDYSGEVKVSQDNEDFDLWQAQTIDDSITYNGDILSNSNFSVSFWIKPITNKTGTTLFTIGDSNYYVHLTTSGSSDGEDGTSYSGISLESKTPSKDFWIVAEGIDTLQTGKYNYVVTQFNNGNATIFLNGEKVAEGRLGLGYTDKTLTFGQNIVYGGNNEEGYVSDLVISSDIQSEEKIKDNYKKRYGDVLLDSITFPSMDDVQSAPWLMDTKVEDIPVTYKSDNPEVMDTYGNLKSVTEDTIVTMTATIDNDDIKATKDFKFTVKALTTELMLERDLTECNSYIQKVIHDGYALPITFSNGALVEWTIISGDAEIVNDEIIKNTENEKEPITIQAKLFIDDKVITKTYDLVLLDKVSGYILSYFNGELGEETGKLAYSTDALNWIDLNNGDSIITSELGNGRIRDPFITRDKEGNFIVLATEGFDNPYIYIMNSKDLVNFEQQDLVRVAYYDQAIQMSGKRAWAPEMMYDMETDQYYIYFSDPGDEDLIGHIYAVATNDFENFSYPYSYFNPGYNVIDGTILPLDGKYWMFYKDERKAAQTIFFASSDSISKGFGLSFDKKFIFNLKYIEGPFVTQFEDNYYLYVDYYPKGTFHVARFNELGEFTNFEWLDETEYKLPNEDVRHGSIIPVTQKELDAILKAY